MIDFTYTVFLIVASVSGLLLAVFAVGVIGVLVAARNPEVAVLADAHHRDEPVEQATQPRAA